MTAQNSITLAQLRRVENGGPWPTHLQNADQRADAVKLEKSTRRYEQKCEKEFQDECAGILYHRGYRNLTAKRAEGMFPGQLGWYIHLVARSKNAAKTAPLLPDLPIWTMDMRHCLPIELKVHDVWQPGQSALVDAGIWEVAWTTEDFELLLDEWEKSHE